MAIARINENAKIAVAACLVFTCYLFRANQRNKQTVSSLVVSRPAETSETCDNAPFGFRVSDTGGRWHGIL